MKIIEIIPTLEVRAGAEVFVADLIDRISIDNEVMLITMYGKIESELEKKLISKQCKIVFLRKEENNFLKSIMRLRKCIEKFSPQIIHTHLSGINYLFPIKNLIPKQCKIFHTLHNIPEKETNNFGHFIRKKFLRYKNFKFVGISDAITKQAKAFYKTTKVLTIYNGRKFEPVLSTSKKEFDFVCVARFNEQKNHNLLIDCFYQITRKNKNLKLICVGAGELLDSIKNKTNNVGLNKNVIFTGPISDVNAVLAKSKVFVLASRYEGNPISVLEALNAGLPVVVPNVGGITDVVKLKNGIVYECGNAEELTSAMFQLINDDNYAKYKSINISYSQKFNIDACAEKYLNLFKRSFL